MSAEPKQKGLFVLGKGRVFPLRAVVDYRGDCKTEGGASAGRWLLACGHVVVIKRSKEGQLKAKRCNQCPMEYSKQR